jgi:Tfp pilus assembly protein PilF
MRTAFLALIVGSACVACGGSSPPAQTGGADNSAASLPDAKPQPPSSPASSGSAEMAAGLKAFDAGDFAGARRSFEAVTGKDPKNYEAFTNLGMTCEKLGDASCAEASYRSAIAARPGYDSASQNLSAMELDAGRADDAIAVARAGIAANPQSGPLHANLANGLAIKGDQDGATKEFAQATQLLPNDLGTQLAFAHWLNVWKQRGAVPHLDQARTLAKDDYPTLLTILLEYRMAGDVDDCVKLADKLVSMKDGGEARTERALCRLASKDEKGAVDDLQAAVKVEPSYAQAHYFLGGRLALAKRPKEAAAEYQKYLDLAPTGSLVAAAKQHLKDIQDGSGKKK